MVQASDMDSCMEGQAVKDEPKLSNSNTDEATGGHQTMRKKAAVKLLMNYYDIAFRWVCHVMKCSSEILAELHVYDFIQEVRVFLGNHPLVAFVLTLIVISCGIPILIFVVFAIITIVFTFGGFLIIEGALLAAGSAALLLCLTSMAVVFMTMGFMGGLVYITYMQVDNMVRVNNVNRVTASDLRLPQVLGSLRAHPQSNPHYYDKVEPKTITSEPSAGHLELQQSKIRESQT